MKVLFIDTNVLIQCLDLKDLPWVEISSGQDILLLVSRAVQEEIDRQKYDGNARRADRARKATANLLRPLVMPNCSRMLIRTSNPMVEIALAPIVAPGESPFPFLDMSRSDDRIILEALEYRKQHPHEQIAFLSHDTGPLNTARQCGLESVHVPNSWLLPPERDPRDKRISELEQKVRTFEQRSPEIQVRVENSKGDPIKFLEMPILEYSKLSEDQVGELVSISSRLHPMATEFDSPDPRQSSQSQTASDAFLEQLTYHFEYKPAEAEEITKYRAEQYPGWLEKVADFFKILPSRLGFPRRHLGFSFSLSNVGGVPAENLVIEFSTRGGLFLAPPKRKINEINFPAPPEVPRGKWIKRKIGLDLFQDLAAVVHSNIPDIPTYFNRPMEPRRDRHSFYWKGEKPSTYVDSQIFECDEFRHKIDSEVFPLVIFAPSKERLRECALKCRVTAKNLIDPFVLELPVRITYQEIDTLTVAAQFITAVQISQNLKSLC